MQSKVTAVVNRAADDQHGWDFIVEISDFEDNTIPPDLQAHVLRCFVQVKTTQGVKAITKVKLSNAVKAANSPAPHFIALLHYTSESIGPRLYVRHVWKNEIEDWLKRARKSERDNKRLSAIMVAVEFAESDLISSPADWMLSQIIQNGNQKYEERKREIIKKVGYNGFTHEGTFIIGPNISLDDIARHEIGLVEDLPIADFSLFDARFGIKSKNPVQFIPEGRIKLEKPGRDILIRLDLEGEGTIELPAILRMPGLISLADINFRARITAGHIDLIFANKTSDTKLDLNYHPSKQFSLEEHAAFLALVNHLQEGSAKLTACSDEGELFRFSLEKGAPIESWMPQANTITSFLCAIFQRETTRRLKLSLQDLTKIERPILLAASALTAGSLRIDARFEQEIDDFSKAVFFHVGSFMNWSFGSIWATPHRARTVDDGRYSLFFSKPELLWARSFKQPIDKMRKETKQVFDRCILKSCEPVAIFQDGDLVDFINATSDDREITLHVEDQSSTASAQ